MKSRHVPLAPAWGVILALSSCGTRSRTSMLQQRRPHPLLTGGALPVGIGFGRAPYPVGSMGSGTLRAQLGEPASPSEGATATAPCGSSGMIAGA